MNYEFATASMFSHTTVASLNNFEMMAHRYVTESRGKVMYVTIYELAEAAGVSITIVPRFCHKLQYGGCSKFRVRLKLYLEQNEPQQANIGANGIVSSFKSVNNDKFDELFEQAVDTIPASERIIFVDAGAPGVPAEYGVRFSSNVGKFNNHIDDPYFPVTNDIARNALAIALSVSGEAEEIPCFASQFSLYRYKVMSITSHGHSRLAKLVDFNLSWHVPWTRVGNVYDIITQTPMIYIPESLGCKLARKIS